MAKTTPKKRPDGRSNNRSVNPAGIGNKRALNNKGGVPTKFKPIYSKMIVEHFSGDPYKKELMEKSEEFFQSKGKEKQKLKRKSYKYKHMPNKLPTLFGFARKVGVAYTTVYQWAMKGEDDSLKEDKEKDDIKKYTEEEKKEREQHRTHIHEFHNSYKEAKELQKEFLMSLGLAGVTPSGAYIFTAKNVTDMRDKQEVDLSSNGKEIKTINYIIPDEPNSKTNLETTSSVPSD